MQNKHPPTGQQKLSPLKRVGLAAGALVLVSVPALLLFADPLANTFIKPRITKAFAEAYPACPIRFADLNCRSFKNLDGTLQAINQSRNLHPNQKETRHG